MNDEILLSIIIPTYKRSDNLINAIESVINQKGNYELIVVDDNDENSIYRQINEKKLEKYINISNFHYLKHKKNMNGAAARNTGINFSKGKYITFLDDDDVFSKERISEFEKVIVNENYDFICSNYLWAQNGKILKKGKPNINLSNYDLQKKLLKQESFFGTGSNLICKSDIVKKINGFDETFIRHQDLEFMIRFLELCNSKFCINKYLVIKNIDDVSNIPNFDKLLNVKKKYLNKFDYLLKKLSISEKKDVFSSNYYELLMASYLLENKEDTNKAIKLLKESGCYNFLKKNYISIKLKLKKSKLVYYIRTIIKR